MECQRNFKRVISKFHFHPQLLQLLKKKESSTLNSSIVGNSGTEWCKSKCACSTSQRRLTGWEHSSMISRGTTESMGTRMQASGGPSERCDNVTLHQRSGLVWTDPEAEMKQTLLISKHTRDDPWMGTIRHLDYNSPKKQSRLNFFPLLHIMRLHWINLFTTKV